MKNKKLLFVCIENNNRSPTAESLFKGSKKYEAKSCGVSLTATIPISEQAISWADIIFCMEDSQKQYILDNFPIISKDKDIRVLNIPDIYIRDDPELIRILKKKLRKLL